MVSSVDIYSVFCVFDYYLALLCSEAILLSSINAIIFSWSSLLRIALGTMITRKTQVWKCQFCRTCQSDSNNGARGNARYLHTSREPYFPDPGRVLMQLEDTSIFIIPSAVLNEQCFYNRLRHITWNGSVRTRASLGFIAGVITSVFGIIPCLLTLQSSRVNNSKRFFS